MTMRRRSAAETREDILDAARIAFSSKGFDQVGVREITASIGVNSSLINRYFGTKEQLFAEVMRTGIGLPRPDEQTWEKALEWLTDYALDVSRGDTAFDPVLALIRSAPIDKAQPILRDYISREAVEPLAALIGGEGANERASLVFALLVGLITLRAIVKSDPLSSTRRNDLAMLIEETFRSAAGRSTPADDLFCKWPRRA